MRFNFSRERGSRAGPILVKNLDGGDAAQSAKQVVQSNIFLIFSLRMTDFPTDLHLLTKSLQVWFGVYPNFSWTCKAPLSALNGQLVLRQSPSDAMSD